jgi:farnesyl diphosphate synthase
MHRLKTGALLQASVMMGAACGEPARARQALRDYGARLGLAFQVVDDILDVTADSRPWARRPARTPRRTSPPTFRCWGWSARAPTPRAAGRGAAALATSGLADTRRCSRWPRWWCTADN